MFYFSILFTWVRVVKARHFYDMNVVKEQNSYIKDKYVKNFNHDVCSIEYFLILVLVKDMQEELYLDYILMSSR